MVNLQGHYEKHPETGTCYPDQKNPMDLLTWWCKVAWVTNSDHNIESIVPFMIAVVSNSGINWGVRCREADLRAVYRHGGDEGIHQVPQVTIPRKRAQTGRKGGCSKKK